MSLKFANHDKDLHQVWSKNHLKGLTPILQEWAALVTTYSDSFNGDACYWYNERTSVGILASAAWRKNWVALEEFATRKASKRVKGDDAPGRCDLKISGLSSSYAIEAKQAWQPIGSKVRDPWGAVKAQFQLAKEDSQVLMRDQATYRLAAVFVTPRLKASDIDKESNQTVAVEAMMDKWLNGIDQLPYVDAYAWVFPWRNRLLRSGDSRYIWPGTLLLIREIKRRVTPQSTIGI